MTHFGLVIGRVLTVGFAALLGYIALFMHEDEEGRLQNRLEELWVRVDDAQRSAITKQSAFLKGVLDLFNRGLNSLFGMRIFSLRAAAVTLCYSEASLILLLFYRIVKSLIPELIDLGPGIIIRAALYSAFLLILGTISVLMKTRKSLAIWLSLTTIITIPGFFLSRPVISSGNLSREAFQDFDLVAGPVIEFLIIVTAGIICDLIFVALNRAIIRRAALLNGNLQIVLMLILNCLVAMLYVAPLWIWSLSDSDPITVRDLVILISSTNVITALLATSVVAIMAVALLHRFFWPFVSRPIYALARFQVARKTTLLLSLAIALLTWAVPPWASLLAKIKGIK